MENVQAAIVNPSPVSTKVAAPEAPADAEGAPLPGAFLAMLSHQVKNLKCAPELEAQATNAQVSGADADLGATDPTLAAQPAVIDLQLLIALPPALPPPSAPAVADAATSAVTPDAVAALADTAAAAAATDAAAVAAASAAIAAAAALAAAAVVVSPTTPAPVVSAAPAVAAATVPAAIVTAAATPGSAQAAVAKLPLAANDAKSQPPGTSASPKDAVRASTSDDAPRAGVSQTREPLHTGTTPNQAASGELPRAGELAPSDGTNGRENKNQVVPSLAFTQAMAPAANTSLAAPAQLQVEAPVGGPGWGTEVGQRVVWMVNEKQQIAELHVNPPDLGPLDIKLTIDDHQTTAVFTSPHSSVREALESALPRLREVLAESGINLGNASVTADTPQDGSAFCQPPARNASSFRAGAHPDAAAQMGPGAATVARGRGLVDLFA